MRRGFTITELFVVLFIVLMLMGLFVGYTNQSHAYRGRMQCTNNLKLLAIELQTYHDIHGRFPATYTTDPATSRSWIPDILPHTDQGQIARQYRYDRGWDHLDNRNVISRPLEFLRCRENPEPVQVARFGRHVVGLTDYSPIFELSPGLLATDLLSPWQGKPQGAMPVETGGRFDDIIDGTSTTLLLCEVVGQPKLYLFDRLQKEATSPPVWAGWTDSMPIRLDGWKSDGSGGWGPCAVNCTNAHEIYSFHKGGANIAMVDGSVRFIRKSTTLQLLAAMVTRAGGETLTLD
jgi:prepilin-type processing-associated H-X9-DG protein